MANLNLTDPVRVGLGVPGAGNIVTLMLDPTGWLATTSDGLMVSERDRPQGLTTYSAEEGPTRAWCRSWPVLAEALPLPAWHVRDDAGQVARLVLHGRLGPGGVPARLDDTTGFPLYCLVPVDERGDT